MSHDSSQQRQRKLQRQSDRLRAPTLGTTYIRCRIANAAGEIANPTGSAATGEVEDYRTDAALAVLLAGFDAASQADHVLVSWETVSEANNAGFNLYRSLSADGEYALLGFTPSASPGSTQPARPTAIRTST
jgi:hypothetical protein